MKIPKPYCVWVRFQVSSSYLKWGPWILLATFVNYRPRDLAREYTRIIWTCRQQRVVLPKGQKPKSASTQTR